MTPSTVIEIGRQAVEVTLLISAPLFIAALATGLLISIFVGWVWGAENAIAELTAEGQHLPAARLWAFLIRYVCPVAILFIIVTTARDLLAG